MKINFKSGIAIGVLSVFLVTFNTQAAPTNKSSSTATARASAKINNPLDDQSHMIYIKYHYYGKDIAVDSFKATPIEVWRVGYKQMKSLEAYSPEDNVQQEIISSEPDAWIMDITSKTGKHLVDPQNGQIHSPILPNQAQAKVKKLFILEFGNEYSFMRNNHAKQLKDEEILGVKTHHWYLEVKNDKQNDMIDLYTDIKTNHPIKMEIASINSQSQDKSYFGIMYENYDDAEVPDINLFKVDPEFKIVEAHSN